MSSKKVSKFLALRLSEKFIFLEAFGLLAFSKIAVRIIPFRKMAAHLGDINKAAGLLSATQMKEALGVRHIIFMTSANVPWKSVCLDQALTAMMMLNRRKLPNTLYLGVKIDEAKRKIEAHAWVKCNDKILVGGPQSKEFKVVAFFSKAL